MCRIINYVTSKLTKQHFIFAMLKSQKNEYELIKFEDGDFTLDVNVSPEENTVWLTQKQMSQL